MITRRLLLLLAALAGALILPAIGGANPSPPYRIWTIAGTGAACPPEAPTTCGDDGPALAARVTPGGVALAPDGSIVIGDGHTIRRLDRAGRISRVAGADGTCTTPACGDGGPALAAVIAPTGIAVTDDGTIYVADVQTRTVRAISPAGRITRIAGTGGACVPPACGDGGRALDATFSTPIGLAVDDRRRLLYVVDFLEGGGGQVRAIDLTAGTIRLVAGRSGTIPPGCQGACGDGGDARAATLDRPLRVTFDATSIYIGERGDVRRVDLESGQITRYAGTGQACSPGACGVAFGDGGPALAAPMSVVTGLVATPDGIVITDQNGSIRRIDAGGTVHLIAGAGICPAPAASCGDGGPALAATFGVIDAVAGDGRGGFVVADYGANAVRWITQGLPPPTTVGLVAFAVTPAAPRHGQALTVSAALTHAARLTLTVRSGTRRLVVRTLAGKVGVNALRWNGRLGGRAARAGRYTLVVTATSGTVTATSSLAVRLR